VRRYRSTGSKNFKKAPNKLKSITFLISHLSNLRNFNNKTIQMRVLLKEKEFSDLSKKEMKEFSYLYIGEGYRYKYYKDNILIYKYQKYGKRKNEFYRVL
jgi:hypothetical protein